jgi:hypothetical protein
MKLPRGDDAIVEIARYETIASIRIILVGDTKPASSQPLSGLPEQMPTFCTAL